MKKGIIVLTILLILSIFSCELAKLGAPPTVSKNKIHHIGCTETPGTSSILSNMQRIINGNKTDESCWRNTVAITYNDDESDPSAYWVECTGTLITPDLVLTAGHCMFETDQSGFQHDRYDAHLFKVYVGSGESDDNLYSGQYSVSKTYLHKNYIKRTQENDPSSAYDFAFLVLSTQIPASEATPVNIYAYDPQSKLDTNLLSNIKNTTVIIVGFGARETHSPGSLKYQARTQVIDLCSSINVDCGSIFQSNLTTYPDARKSEIQLNRTAEYPGNTCSGDSGGPSFIYDDDEWKQLSVVSRGPPQCEGSPEEHGLAAYAVNWFFADSSHSNYTLNSN